MMNDSSFSFINCYYINFCCWSVLKTLLMHIMKDSQCVVAAKSDKNHYHLAWPWHKKAKFTDFLPLQILCHLFLKIYLFILGGVVFEFTLASGLNTAQGSSVFDWLIPLSLDHISLQQPARGAEQWGRSTERMMEAYQVFNLVASLDMSSRFWAGSAWNSIPPHL